MSNQAATAANAKAIPSNPELEEIVRGLNYHGVLLRRRDCTINDVTKIPNFMGLNKTNITQGEGCLALMDQSVLKSVGDLPANLSPYAGMILLDSDLRDVTTPAGLVREMQVAITKDPKNPVAQFDNGVKKVSREVSSGYALDVGVLVGDNAMRNNRPINTGSFANLTSADLFANATACASQKKGIEGQCMYTGIEYAQRKHASRNTR
jgi:hypothetical protein